MGLGLSNAQSVYVQFLNPAAGDQQRGLPASRVSRDQPPELAETLMAGQSPIAHTFMFANQPDTGKSSAFPRYDYDPQRGTQFIEDSDRLERPTASSSIGRDGSLTVELRTYSVRSTRRERSRSPTTGSGRGPGVDVKCHRVGVSNEYVFTYRAHAPAVHQRREAPAAPVQLQGADASEWFPGGNIFAIRNPEFMALLDRYFTTIPSPTHPGARADPPPRGRPGHPDAPRL